MNIIKCCQKLKITVSLREAIRSLRVGEVDVVIESAGGWAIK
jgi:hypothetical protein